MVGYISRKTRSPICATALIGAIVSVGQTNGALLTDLTFVNVQADASLQFAFGATLADARAALAQMSGLDAITLRAQSDDASGKLIAAARLPNAALAARVLEVAKRALLNLYVSRDNKTGAMMASAARQPPHHLDWARDGAFFSA